MRREHEPHQSMSAASTLKTRPWQPLTFGGVAAFAGASLARLFGVELIVALLAAGSSVWFLHSAWEPSLRQAISQLPDTGAVRNGRLEWPAESPKRLAEGSFLSVVVDFAGTGELGFVADLQLEFRERDFRLRAVLGYLTLRYPTGWRVPMNRLELDPWWGAWRSVVFVGLGFVVTIGLLVAWAVLATFYLWPVRAIAFYADRQLTVTGAWRLASAAMLPGALLMSAAIIAYSLQRLNLIQLLFAGLLHLLVGWVFLVISPMWLPRVMNGPTNRAAKNPFRPPRT